MGDRPKLAKASGSTRRISKSFLTELFEDALKQWPDLDLDDPHAFAGGLADHVMTQAWDLEYMPRRDRLVLYFDLPDPDAPIPYTPTS